MSTYPIQFVDGSRDLSLGVQLQPEAPPQEAEIVVPEPAAENITTEWRSHHWTANATSFHSAVQPDPPNFDGYDYYAIYAKAIGYAVEDEVEWSLAPLNSAPITDFTIDASHRGQLFIWGFAASNPPGSTLRLSLKINGVEQAPSGPDVGYEVLFN